MGIIERYIGKEILQSLVGITLILLLIVVGNRFLLVLEETVSGAISAKFVFSMLYLNTITQLGFLLPFSFYLATLLALGRLYKDSEMSALAACGVGQQQILNAVLIIAVFVAMVVSALSLFLTPWAYGEVGRLEQISKRHTDVAAFKSGEFKTTDDGRGVLYIEKVDVDTLHLGNVFIRGLNEGQSYVVTAKAGYQTRETRDGYKFLVLEDGRRYEGQAGRADYTVIDFHRYRLRLRDEFFSAPNTNRMTRSTLELLMSKAKEDIAEWQWRVSLPVATVFLGLMAVPLSRTNPRQGRYAKIFIAILIFAIYVNFMAMSKVWIEKGELNIYFGLWWTHLVASLFVVVTVLKQTGIRWRFSKGITREVRK